MMSLELKKSYFEELLGRPMSQNYNATEVRTNMNLRSIRKALTLVGFKEYPADLDDATVTHFKKEAVHIVVIVLTSHNTALDVEIEQVKTDPETGVVICCFNCAGYDQEDGFCNYYEIYKDEQEKCRHFEPYNG